MKKLCVSVLVLFATNCSNFFGGGKTDDLEGKIGNATVVYEYNGDKSVDEVGMTINRLRIWKSRSNQESSGVSSQVDLFNVEVWYELEGDLDLAKANVPEKDKDAVTAKSRYAILTGLKGDDDGNLFYESAEPGTTFFLDPPSDPLTSDGLFSYTVAADTGLVSKKFPAIASWTETTGSDSISKKQLIRANEIDESGWEDVFHYTIASAIDSRTRFEENADFAQKAKLGCLVKSKEDGFFVDKSFVFGDVELGALLQDREDVATSSSDTDPEVLGDDDSLWIEWKESFYFSGINYKTHSVHLFRSRYAPFYLARELPGIDSSNTSPVLSGVEDLVRQCNAAAGEGGTFRLISLTGSSYLTPTLSIDSSNNYCATLENATDSLDLSSTSYGACAFTMSAIEAGTWNGTAHTGPVSSISGALKHWEMSPLIEVNF